VKGEGVLGWSIQHYSLREGNANLRVKNPGENRKEDRVGLGSGH